MKQIAVVLAVSMVFGANASARKIDLSKFDGTYEGKGIFTAGVQSHPLTAKAKFLVAKNGQSAKVRLSGVVDAQGNFLKWGTTLKLRRNGKLATSNILALDLGAPAFAGKGRFKVLKGTKTVGSSSKVVGSEHGEQKVAFLVERAGKTRKRLGLDIHVLRNGAAEMRYEATLTGR